MYPRPIHCRRLRRTDAAAVFALLAAAGGAAPPADRHHRHRLRQVVADLGSDCYVALVDETVAGLVHVTYARQLVGGPRARVERLLLDPADDGAAVPRALAALVAARARRRGCAAIEWRGPATGAAAAFAAGLGVTRAAEHWTVEIPVPAE